MAQFLVTRTIKLSNKLSKVIEADSMARFLVIRTIKLSKVIEADSKEEALEYFDEINADTELVKETAKKIAKKKHTSLEKIMIKNKKGCNGCGYSSHFLYMHTDYKTFFCGNCMNLLRKEELPPLLAD